MKRQVDESLIAQFQLEVAELLKWDGFSKSDFGKHFIKFLDNAILETVEEEDKFNIYDKTEHIILYQVAAARSKRQTLRAIKEKILGAEDKAKELGRELSKYQE